MRAHPLVVIEEPAALHGRPAESSERDAGTGQRAAQARAISRRGVRALEHGALEAELPGAF
jgi:hypothetical protein